MKPKAHPTKWTLVFATKLQRFDTLQEAEAERDKAIKRGEICFVQAPLAARAG
jgi:hypothetical protein